MTPTNSINKKNKNNKLLSSLLLFTFLIGCGGENLTDFEYIQRAKAHIVENNPKSAILELKNALRINSDNSEARYLISQMYIDLGDGVSAEKELRKAEALGLNKSTLIQLYAKSFMLQREYQKFVDEVLTDDIESPKVKAELLINSSIAHKALDNNEKSTRALTEAIKLANNDKYLVSYAEALQATYEEKLESAISLAQTMLEASPRSIDAMNLLGILYLRNNNFEKSIQEFSKLKQRQPYFIPHHTNEATAYLRLNKPDDAIKILKPLSSKAPNNPIINTLMANAYFLKKDYEKTKVLTEKSLAILPGSLRTRFIAAVANYMNLEFEQSHDHLTYFLSKNPGYEPAQKMMAAVQLKLGFPRKAAEHIKTNKTISQDDIALITAIADQVVSLGDYDSGIALYKRASAETKNSTTLKTRLALTEFSAGDESNAVKILENMSKNEESSAESDSALIVLYLQQNKFQKALDASLTLIKNQPENVTAYNLAAMSQSKLQNHGEAKKLLSKALEIAPGNPRSSLMLAAYMTREGNIEEASKIYNDGLKMYPNHPELITRLADIKFQTGNTDEAISMLKEAAASKNSPIIDLTLSRVYFKTNDYSSAITQASSPQYTSEPAFLEIIAKSKLELNQNEEALRAAKKLTELSPQNAASHVLLTQVYEKLGDKENALDAITSAAKIAPQHLPTKFAYARLLVSNKKYSLASKQLNSIEKDAQNNIEVLKLKAKIALGQNNADEAVTILRKVLEKNETNLITISLAGALEKAGKPKESQKVLSNWISRFPNDILARQTLGESLLLSKNYDKAKPHFIELSKGNKNARALNNLAWIESLENDFTNAEQHIQAALSLAPKSSALLETQGQIYFKQKKYKNASLSLQDALLHAPNNNDIKYLLARSELALGNKDKARALLTETSKDTSFEKHAESARLLKTVEGNP